MRILAIETSCDETAIAILDITGPREKPDIKILGNSLLSQIHIHEEYGGVVPNLAKREHQKNLPILLEKTLKEAGGNSESPDIEIIAVTQGPGLEPALWTGITFAEELGKRWSKPVMGVNHMEGHIFSVLPNASEGLKLPALALLVSGGHTELVRIKEFESYEIIGKTRDDAVGEAFDKVARILGLGYPGGPKISKLASEHRASGLPLNIKFPRPMISSNDLDFSYSGLKTAVLYKVKEMVSITKDQKAEIARAFEDAAVDVLIEKTRRALETDEEVKSLIVGGGVSANKFLKERLVKLVELFPHVTLHLPSQNLATDNAVMIGIAAYIRRNTGTDHIASTGIKASGNLKLS